MTRYLSFLPALLFLVIAVPAKAIEIKEVVSPKGIKAWLVEDHANPIVTLHFVFRGGIALDPAGKEGLANLVASTLDEGGGNLTSQKFQRKLEDKAISLGFDASRDGFSGSLRTLTRNQDTAFDLMRLAVTKPRFDSEAVERIRNQIMAGIRRNSENPQRIAAHNFYLKMFPNHPYGRPSDGSLESIRVINLVDLKLFVSQRLALDNLIISAVGDITPGKLKTVLDQIFGALPPKASPWKITEITPQSANSTVVIEKSIPQSVILFGQAGIKRNHPDFYAAYVMNYVLGGGGFESRLYEEIREKRGLAYSAYSYLYPLDHAGLIIGGTSTANARVNETLSVLKNEWRRMSQKGLTPEELKDAKTYLTGSYALRFSSSQRIARMMTGIQLEKLGIDYIEKRNGYIQSVTLAHTNRVAAKLLDPNNLTTVIVGKPDGVKATP